MLEAIAVPVVLKAVDFLFEEVSKIINDSKTKRNNPKQDEKKQPELAFDDSVESVISTKEQATIQPISEDSLRRNKAKIEHLIRLLEIYTKNYYLAKEKYARWGSELVPAVIVHSLDESEEQVIQTAKELQDVLSDMYGKKVINPLINL